MTTIRVRRVYEAPSGDDGFRILVDRLWPRGLGKAKARIDLWAKDVAPSDALRRRFHHDPTQWASFREAYHAELHANAAAVVQLEATLAAHPVATLLFGAREERFNNAQALREYLGRGRAI